MKIALIGVGAMGSLFAAYLAPWAEVVMIGHWAAQLAALQAQGLTVVHPNGRQTHHPIQSTHATTLASVPPADLVLILVKSYQTPRAAALATDLLAPEGIALTLQNGLGNLEQIAAAVGAHRTVQGVTAQGATMLGPGKVRHAGHGPTHLAQTPPTAVRLAAVAACFRRAGLETHLVDEMDSLVWGKLAVNAGINPLTALLRVPNGYLAENEQARKIMSLAAAETAAVAQAQGILLPYSSAAQRTLEVAEATGANHSSMLQDVLRGAPTEIEAICGAVVAYGRRFHVPTPVNEQLLKWVREIESGGKTTENKEKQQAAILQSLLKAAS